MINISSQIWENWWKRRQGLYSTSSKIMVVEKPITQVCNAQRSSHEYWSLTLWLLLGNVM